MLYRTLIAAAQISSCSSRVIIILTAAVPNEIYIRVCRRPLRVGVSDVGVHNNDSDDVVWTKTGKREHRWWRVVVIRGQLKSLRPIKIWVVSFWQKVNLILAIFRMPCLLRHLAENVHFGGISSSCHVTLSKKPCVRPVDRQVGAGWFHKMIHTPILLRDYNRKMRIRFYILPVFGISLRYVCREGIRPRGKENKIRRRFLP